MMSRPILTKTVIAICAIVLIHTTFVWFFFFYLFCVIKRLCSIKWKITRRIAQNPSFLRLNIPPFLKNDMNTVMWVKVPDHESNLSCCLACMTLVECQHTVTSFTSISRLRDFYDNLVYVTHYEKNKSHFHYHTR